MKVENWFRLYIFIQLLEMYYNSDFLLKFLIQNELVVFVIDLMIADIIFLELNIPTPKIRIWGWGLRQASQDVWKSPLPLQPVVLKVV
jgi:hypothetical protein